MNIEGSYTLQARPEEVWQCFMNQQTLLHIIPGMERLEKRDKDSYEIAVRINYERLKGTYHGRLTVVEQHYPSHYRIVIDGAKDQNNINGAGSIVLKGHNDTTIITYHGTLNLHKHGAFIPPALGKGAAKLFIQQCFTALADHIHKNNARQELRTEGTEEIAVVKQPGGDIVILPTSVRHEHAPAQSMFGNIVHLLKLGASDPIQAEKWEQRLRRISIISGLLFLIWIGTRLPRRK